MNISALAQTAYFNAKTPIKTERSIEYQIFSKVTHQLKTSSPETLAGFKELAKAVQINRKLWNILAVDVSDSQNKLPQNLRAQIFYLAEFTEIHSQKVLSGSETVDALVSVNTSIMRGLRNSLEVAQ